MALRTRGIAAALAVTAALAGLAGCGSGTDASAEVGACRDYVQYGKHEGSSVRIMSSIRDLEAANFTRTFRAFEKCTGIKVVWDGKQGFEADLRKQLEAKAPPNLAIIAQPGLLQYSVASGQAKPASAQLTTLARAEYSGQWLDYGTVGDVFYAAPLGANVKSWVWYSPAMFRRNNWKVPTTWAELKSLTARIAAEGDVKPWCAGIESGKATGWPLTDWIEDVVLRLDGPDVYEDWVEHKIPFTDPRIKAAFDEVGGILKNRKYTNGGYGDPASIASTPYQEGGLPILDGECAMYRMASFYVNQWPAGTEVARDGDVYAFYLPSVDGTSRPVLIGGEFVTRFTDDAATQAVQLYMASPEFANDRAAQGGWISPSRGLRLTSVEGKLDEASVELLRDPAVVVAFDGSDSMPDAVGAGTFWSEGTEWIKGQSTDETVAKIDASWPR
ncbi:MAG: ABC transporter substrate-binding protein [Kineosporiaceae bacterium]